MRYLITGGSTSGKSAMAEQIATSFDGPRYYVATMNCMDEESRKRVERHRKMREGKGFITIEQTNDIHHLQIKCSCDIENQRIQDIKNRYSQIRTENKCQMKQANYRVVLVECMSNLLANEMFTNEQMKRYEEMNNKGLLSQDVACWYLPIAKKIVADVTTLAQQTDELILVSNEVFSDGADYDGMTMGYVKALGYINTQIAKDFDVVMEAVYGIPIVHKDNRQENERIV